MNNGSTFVGFKQTAFLQFHQEVNRILAGFKQRPISTEEAMECFDGCPAYEAAWRILNKRWQQEATAQREKRREETVKELSRLKSSSTTVWLCLAFAASFAAIIILSHMF